MQCWEIFAGRRFWKIPRTLREGSIGHETLPRDVVLRIVTLLQIRPEKAFVQKWDLAEVFCFWAGINRPGSIIILIMIISG